MTVQVKMSGLYLRDIPATYTFSYLKVVRPTWTDVQVVREILLVLCNNQFLCK